MRRIILCCLTLTALAAVPALADLRQTTDSTGPFMSAEFIEDQQANIVLTRQREFGRNGFGVDLRGLRDPDGQWRVEYFCEPDSVLIVSDRTRAQAFYMPYLVWQSDATVSASQATVETRRVPSMGTYQSLLPHGVSVSEPNADIDVVHILREGTSIVQTTVAVTNRDSQPKRFTYVYQDAAFMWFPDSNQDHVESVRLLATSAGLERHYNSRSFGSTPVGNWQFTGTFDRAHGVIAGIVTTEPDDIAGITWDYVGVRQVEINGRPYFVARQNIDIPPLQPSLRRTYVNRFIALDFGELAPGESKMRYYNRIMTVLTPDRRNEAGIETWVMSMVRRIQGG